MNASLRAFKKWLPPLHPSRSVLTSIPFALRLVFCFRPDFFIYTLQRDKKTRKRRSLLGCLKKKMSAVMDYCDQISDTTAAKKPYSQIMTININHNADRIRTIQFVSECLKQWNFTATLQKYFGDRPSNKEYNNPMNHMSVFSNEAPLSDKFDDKSRMIQMDSFIGLIIYSYAQSTRKSFILCAAFVRLIWVMIVRVLKQMTANQMIVSHWNINRISFACIAIAFVHIDDDVCRTKDFNRFMPNQMDLYIDSEKSNLLIKHVFLDMLHGKIPNVHDLHHEILL